MQIICSQITYCVGFRNMAPTPLTLYWDVGAISPESLACWPTRQVLDLQSCIMCVPIPLNKCLSIYYTPYWLCAVQVQRPSAAEFPLAQCRSFVLVRPSTDWMRLTHIMDSSLLCTKSTNLKVNLIQKYPHRNTQKNV